MEGSVCRWATSLWCRKSEELRVIRLAQIQPRFAWHDALAWECRSAGQGGAGVWQYGTRPPLSVRRILRMPTWRCTSWGASSPWTPPSQRCTSSGQRWGARDPGEAKGLDLASGSCFTQLVKWMSKDLQLADYFIQSDVQFKAGLISPRSKIVKGLAQEPDGDISLPTTGFEPAAFWSWVQCPNHWATHIFLWFILTS